MAVELNADLAKFQTFMSKLGREDSTSVQLGEDHETLGVATKTAGRLSRAISPFKSTSEARTENNRVRAEFLKAVTFQFGGRLANIPKPVMDALRIKDYELDVSPDGNVGIMSGKPLTARRIAQVLAAVKTELGMVPATGENRLAVATRNFTDKIVALVNSEDPNAKSNRNAAIQKYGSTRAEIEQHTKARLEKSPYLMSLINMGKPDKAFRESVKAVMRREIEHMFGTALKEGQNCGFTKEMLRAFNNVGHFAKFRLNGHGADDATLKNVVPDEKYTSADGTIKEQKKWVDQCPPPESPEGARFCTALKALIPNDTILKCLTSMLGLNGPEATFSFGNIKKDDNVLLAGHNLGAFDVGGQKDGLLITLFATNAGRSGSVDITVKDGKVELKQRFQIGPQIMMVDNKFVGGGDSFLNVPLFTATSTITIPLDQNPSYGEMPKFTTDLKLENLIPEPEKAVVAQKQPKVAAPGPKIIQAQAPVDPKALTAQLTEGAKRLEVGSDNYKAIGESFMALMAAIKDAKLTENHDYLEALDKSITALRTKAEAQAKAAGLKSPRVVDYLYAVVADLDKSAIQKIFGKKNCTDADAQLVIDTIMGSDGMHGTDEEVLDGIVKTLRDNHFAPATTLDDDALKAALLRLLNCMKVSGVNKFMLGGAVRLVGGGIRTEQSYPFRIGGTDYTSKVTPQKSAGEPPLVNFATSTLTTGTGKDEKTLVTFNRFGTVGTEEDTVDAHFNALITSTFLANPSLVEAAKQGKTSFELPIYRCVMETAKHSGPCLHYKDNRECDTGLTVEVKVGDRAVQVHAKVHDAYLPTDGDGYERNRPISDEQIDATMKTVEALRKEAEAFLQNPAVDAQTKKEVELLSREVSDYATVFQQKATKENSNGIVLYRDRCVELHRFGARMMLLAAKLGNVPAINCNWGRDRTGAMDNEIKMLAIQLENQRGEKKLSLAPIKAQYDKDHEIKNDPDELLRTNLLVATGNVDLARQANFSTGPVNLNQGGTDGGIAPLFRFK